MQMELGCHTCSMIEMKELSGWNSIYKPRKNTDATLVYHNRNILQQFPYCGCFFCGRVFHRKSINEWIDDDQTALCPHCKMDTIIPNTNITPVFKKNFMKGCYHLSFSSCNNSMLMKFYDEKTTEESKIEEEIDIEN